LENIHPQKKRPEKARAIAPGQVLLCLIAAKQNIIIACKQNIIS
jgi:hypothetical protein